MGCLINDNILEYILKNLREIDHVEIIRIGTRAPVVFPQRITENLCKILKKYHPIWLNTHFNTSIEITEESKRPVKCLQMQVFRLEINRLFLLESTTVCQL